MKSKRSIQLLFSLLAISSLVKGETALAWSQETTHPALTDRIVDVYNKNGAIKISDAEKEWIIEGSILEDTPPRWVNHLYDPIRNIGWSGEKLGNLDPDAARLVVAMGFSPEGVYSSKEWLHKREVQRRYSRYEGDRTWEQAIEYYAAGNKKEAYKTLGFILHLMEDAAVPDHTRNDPHPHSLELVGESGSPFEAYAKRWNRENIGEIAGDISKIEPIRLASADEYFDSMARYSNRYFFSKDTINDPDYSFPKISKESEKFGYGIDDQGIEFPIVKIILGKNNGLEINKKYILEEKDDPIFSAYFTRLSKQAIAHGAGIVELFFRQAEDAKENTGIGTRIIRYDFSFIEPPSVSLFGEITKLGGGMRTFFGAVVEAAGNAFGTIASVARQTFFSDGETTRTISLDGDAEPVGSEAPLPEETACSFNSAERAEARPAVINEVAWMGDSENARNEWFEIKNISGAAVNLSGFSILDKSGDVKIAIPAGTLLKSGEIVLFAREGGKLAGGFGYRGLLSNQNDGLRLLNPSCKVMDEAIAVPDWPAGDNTAKKTMERDAGLVWYSSSIAGGTPGKENSALPRDDEAKQKNTDKAVDGTDGRADAATNIIDDHAPESAPRQNVKKETIAPKPAVLGCSFETGQAPVRRTAIINEIAWMGGDEATGEWLEIRLVGDAPASLQGWQVVDKDEQVRIVIDDTSLYQKDSLLLFERTSDNSAPGARADGIYSGALSNANEGLRLFNNQCTLEDEAIAAPEWPAGDAAARKTMERAADFSWYTSTAKGGTPRRANSDRAERPGAPGASGGSGGVAAENTAKDPNAGVSLRFTEIMYDLPGSDSGREWIEIQNNGLTPADIAALIKLREGGTDHRLALAEGPALLAVGGYAIIADNPVKFFEDNPGFDGMVFDSSFSLSNTGETLALMLNDAKLDEVMYESGWGAAGDGNSLQRGSWYAAPPTPGAVSAANPNPSDGVGGGDTEEDENETVEAADNNDNGSGEDPVLNRETVASNVVISEIQVGGASSGDEFVELYNPTDAPVSLSGWSLQYVSGMATSTANAAKKNFEASSTVPAKGFFLVARGLNAEGADGYAGSKPADLTQRTISLSGAGSGAIVLVVGTTTAVSDMNDASIVDKIAYGSVAIGGIATSSVPNSGQSIERKAWVRNACANPNVSENEFSGNGCSAGGESSAMVIRASPSPQNTGSFPEPRAKPQAPAPTKSAVAVYNSDRFLINFSWQSSADYAGATATVSYLVREESFENALYEGTSTVFDFRPDEVGKSYKFSVTAKDNDGLSSDAAVATLPIPSFITKALWFADSREGKSGDVLEFYYAAHPFVPDIYRSFANDTWRAVVVYKNTAAPKYELLETAHEWAPEDTTDALPIEYKRCASGSPQESYSLILPDASDKCGLGGGLHNKALLWSELEDLHVLVKNTAAPGEEDDFITLAFFALYQTGGGNQTLKLVAVDATRYEFQADTPAHDAPAPPALELSFDENKVALAVSVGTTTDADTLDANIAYELNYATSSALDESAWQALGSGRSKTFSVDPAAAYLIAARAVDDFGTVSAYATTTWSAPDDFVALPRQLEVNLAAPLEGVVGQPEVKAQKIVMDGGAVIDGIALWPGFYSGAYGSSKTFIAIAADDNNAPGVEIATSTDVSIGQNDGNGEAIYEFPAGVTLEASTSYWIVPYKFGGNNSRYFGSAADAYPAGRWRTDPGKDAYFWLRRVEEVR